MECNRDEAARAKEIAERKLIEKDFAGAKKFAMKAHNLYPCLDGISQMLATIDVYVFSEKKVNGEADWYGVLGVNPRDCEDAVRKQYRKLVLMLHPDKNKAKGADGAFILVSQAWDVLSDKTKRSAYDKKILQHQNGGSWTPPAQNNFRSSKSGSNMKVPKDNSVPVDLHKQKPVSTDPSSSRTEKPHKRASSRKDKPPTRKNASSEYQPNVPPLRKHASSSKEKPANVPPPHKHEPSVVSPSSNIPKPENASVSSHKETPPSVPSPHKHKPSTVPYSSCEKPAVTPLSSHKERPQTVQPTDIYNSSTVHASSRKQETSTMHASSDKQKSPMASVSAHTEKMPVVPPSKKPRPSNIPASCHKQKAPNGPVSSHKHKPGGVAASSHEGKPRVVPVTSSKRNWVPGNPDQPKKPKETAEFRCNGCKMQFEYPRANIKQSMICPKCFKLAYEVKKGS
ncbi:J domain-containing protein [Heracleum sosnowskyi]|uniref:J domain-containing protein n=1 Tax=Heracleum sosnowskyi TaxID=360622 RepID=A0AAD8IMZ1_9APIA|nr:J domain-containing protein [Heracleum sosnowskyi]